MFVPLQGEAASPEAAGVLNLAALDRQQQQIDALELALRGQGGGGPAHSSQPQPGGTSSYQSQAGPPPQSLPGSPTPSPSRSSPQWPDMQAIATLSGGRAQQQQHHALAPPPALAGVADLEERIAAVEAALKRRAAADGDRDAALEDMERRLAAAEARTRRVEAELATAAADSTLASVPAAVSPDNGLEPRSAGRPSGFVSRSGLSLITGRLLPANIAMRIIFVCCMECLKSSPRYRRPAARS